MGKKRGKNPPGASETERKGKKNGGNLPRRKKKGKKKCL